MFGRRAHDEGSALVALVASVAVLVATPTALLVSQRGEPSQPSIGDRSLAISASPESIAVSASPSERRSARPVGLSIPALNIETSVVPAGVSEAGVVEVPENIALVGWYRFGARPGDATGSTVIVGHRDGRTAGAGALFRVSELKTGDRVSVFDSDWQKWTYRIVARESFDKGDVPYDEIFAATGAPRLTVISCGGRFLAERGSYEDNIVVTAVPVGDVTP